MSPPCYDKLYHEATVRAPSKAHLGKIAKNLGLDLDDDELSAYQRSIKDACDAINEVEGLPEPLLPTKYPRVPGHRPTPEENPLNAWYWKTNITGAESGKLLGKTVAVKDNIAVAGVPMMVGCSALEGYVPEFDATVVTMLLDQGARVTGKSVCESLCGAGASYTCNKGPVKNFHNPNHNAGGSSGGSATLVASGEVDLALGSDQGGSVRIPSCWCGVVGLKPTFGLVPYTGAMAFEQSVDHLGPIARSVYDCALFLEVLAGYDNGLDPRQRSDMKVPQYTTEMIVESLEGFKIGVINEGFEWKTTDDEVERTVRGSVSKLQDAGAKVEQVSIPLHAKGHILWRMVFCEGFADTTFHSGGVGRGSCGFHATSMSSFVSKSFKTRINDVGPSPKLLYLLGQYFAESYPGVIYNKGQNLRRLLAKQYDDALNKFDVLALPTIPFTAPRLPDKNISTEDYLANLGNISVNTRPTNLTGHPAISLKAGFHHVNGLPIGTMLISKHFDEVTLFKVASHFERLNSSA
ncbi:putative glutamyl-tRNA(Gln) amidotransferase subunit A, chloroplastic/mitochondrial [Apostichopus japonicus]|uniref:Putative glutamyl-tRNA(Gln) amidotransferase subunit A, chloroplastic/mitochondrial n=1 Tax=Stichopus japonicus TaxID=307972 RepID=A0A2G8KI94_STIJA|nr:putative glutamyl-tRNA(Gln) amidotransferase subunit A, chloroplastic/mitochondrial [Apostichopus japonicus]